MHGTQARSVVYIVRSRVENAQLVAQQIKATNAQRSAEGLPALDYSVFLMPRKTHVCEKVWGQAV